MLKLSKMQKKGNEMLKGLVKAIRNQITLKKMAKKKVKRETNSIRHKKITKQIAGVLVHDFQHFSFVEDRGFKELMEELEPHYEISHRTTFYRSIIPRIHKEVKEQVKSKVGLQQRKNKVALTTDMWLSEANEAYLG